MGEVYWVVLNNSRACYYMISHYLIMKWEVVLHQIQSK